MVESKAMKVRIQKESGDVEVKEVILREPTGKDQIAYLTAIKDMDDGEPLTFINGLNKFIAQTTSLSEEEVMNMFVVDKEEIGEYLMQRHLGFVKKFKSFMKD